MGKPIVGFNNYSMAMWSQNEMPFYEEVLLPLVHVLEMEASQTHARRSVSYLFLNLGHKIVRNINNCTDLGNCLDPVNT